MGGGRLSRIRGYPRRLGSAQRVDKEGGELPPAEESPEDLKTQAITLSSERLRVIAKMDVVQIEDGHARPIDYKRGRPAESGDGPGVWPADRVQIVLQAMILRESGYRCEEGIVYYRATNQRVRVPITEDLIEEAEAAVANAWRTARQRLIPRPSGGFAEMSGLFPKRDLLAR